MSNQKQIKDLIIPIAISDGIKVSKLEVNYVYFNDNDITIYYKQGITASVAYDVDIKKGLKAIEDAGSLKLTLP